MLLCADFFLPLHRHSILLIMSSFIIANRECVFPSVSYATLHLYQPTCSTWELAWPSGNTSLNIMLCTSLDLAFQVGAIAKPAVCVSDDVNQRFIYLVELLSAYWLEYFEFWLRQFFFGKYLVCCPYNVALRKRLQEIDEIERDGQVAEYVIARKMDNLKAGRGAVLD